MSIYTEMTDEQWRVAQEDFIKKYGAPRIEPVKVLNLIMRKEFAEAILKGEKTVEIRSYSNHYYNRLTDKKVDAWMEQHFDDEKINLEEFDEFMCATRPVENIHFHNYNNSWYLDVTCVQNGLTGLTRNNIEALQDKYGFHELDEELEKFERKEKGKEVLERPLFYWFAIGEVLGTNLKV